MSRIIFVGKIIAVGINYAFILDDDGHAMVAYADNVHDFFSKDKVTCSAEKFSISPWGAYPYVFTARVDNLRKV